MSDAIDNILNGIGGSESLTNSLKDFGQPAPIPEKTPQQQAIEALSNPSAVEALGASEINNGVLADQKFAKDLKDMDYGTLLRTYGENVAKNRWKYLTGKQKVTDPLTNSRTTGEIAKDTALAIGGGALAGINNLESSALSIWDGYANAVNSIPRKLNELGLYPDALTPGYSTLGVARAEQAQKGQNYINSFKSDPLKDRLEATNKIRADQEINSEAERKEDVAQGTSPLVADLKKIGRDFITEAGNLVDDPAVSGDVVSQGIGSLVTSGGVVGKLAKIGGGTKLATATGVGVVESAGTFTQAANDVLEMSESQLLTGSDRYIELRAELNHEEARKIVAQEVANKAAINQLPVATATGLIAGKFEAAPLSAGSVKEAVKNIGFQVVEEAVQSGTAEANTNKAVKDVADSSRNVTDGVGVSAAQGAVGGLGAATAAQGPAVVSSSVKTVLSPAAQKSVELGKSIIEARNQRIQDSIDKDSPVGPEATVQAQKTVVETAAVDPELNEVISFKEGEIEALPETIKGMFDNIEGGNKIDTLVDIVNNVGKGEFTPEQEKDLVLYAFSEVSKLQEFALSERTDNEALNVAKDAILDLASNKSFVEAVQKAVAVDENVESDVEITEVTQADVDTSVRIAEANPSGVDPKKIDAILDQHARGKIIIPEILIKKIKAASRIAKEVRKTEALKASIEQERVDTINAQGSGPKVEVRKTRDIVRREINFEGKRVKIKGQGEKILPSLNDFYSNVLGSISSKNGTAIDRNGQLVDAQSSFDQLGNFAQHMINKVEAINTSAKGGRGEKVSYRTLTPFGFVEAGEKGSSQIFANAKSPNSISTAKEALVDANSAIDLYNNLLDLYPEELTGEKIERPNLDQSLNRGLSVVQADDQSKVSTEAFAEPRSAETTERPAEEASQEQNTNETQEEVIQNETNSTEPQKTESKEPSEETEPSSEGEAEPAQEVVEEPQTEGTEAEAVNETEDTGDVAESVLEARSYDNLISDNFSKAFTITEDQAIPSYEQVKEAFSTAEGIKELATEPLPYLMDDTARKDFAGMLEKAIPTLVKRLNGRLDTAKVNKTQTVRQALAAGKDLANFRDTRATNLIDDGTGDYDTNLIEQASMAAVHWIMTSAKGRSLDIDEVADAFNVSPENVTSEMQDALNFGMSATAAKEALSNIIQNFWGSKANPDASMSLTRGIPEALAAELITVMDGIMLNTKRFKITKEINGKMQEVDYVAISTESENSVNFVKSMGPAKTVLGDLLLGQSPDLPSFGKPHTTVVKTQKRNPLSKITDKEQRVIKSAQQIKFFRNPAFIKFMRALGEDGYTKLLGSSEIDVTSTNKVHAKSLEGVNMSNASGYRQTIEQDESLSAYADANGTTANDTPVYYNWYITKVGRLHMNGFGPQADKTAREAYSATVSTLDLTKLKDNDFFWMTVAQSSDLVKTEKVTRVEAVKQAKEVYTKYPKTLEILRGWLRVEDGALNETEIQSITDELGAVTAKQIHSLISVAQYDNAYTDGSQSEFKHMLSLEADGKTDGPINAMMNFISGRFTNDQLGMLAKGGFFLNQEGRTLNDHYQNDPADLYQVGASRFTELLGTLNQYLVENYPDSAKYMSALLNFSNHFGEIEFVDGDLVIGRNTLKNPLTVTVYGSGANGIAQKVSSALMTSFYEELTKKNTGKPSKLDDYPTISEDIKTLFGNKTFQNPKTLEWSIINSNDAIASSRDLTNFEFSLRNKENFNTNVKSLFVTPMYQAINEMMGETTETTTQFQTATQIQSIVLIDKFQKALDAKLKEKREAGEIGKGEFLSQNDYNAVFKEVEKFGSIVENDEQILNFATAEKGESRYEFSRSLDGKLGGPSSLPAPSEAGVRAAPYITINRGDAQMVNNIYDSKDVPLRSLPVFDGIELAADDIDTASEMINRSVTEAWLQNPAKDVSDSFSAFLRTEPLKDLSQEAETKLRKMLGMNPEDNIEEVLKGVRNTLEDTAKSIQARKEAISEVTFSVDHMASAESPYTNKGKTLEGNIIEEINALYEAKLPKEDREAIQEESSEFKDLVSKYGKEENGITFLDTQTFEKLMEEAKLSKELSEIFNTLKTNLDPSTVFVFGSPLELTQFRDSNFPDRNDGKMISKGQIDLLNNVIYVGNQSPETVLHEAVHAATMGKVLDFYTDSELLNDDDTASLRRLEALMDEFLKQDFRYDDEATRNAASDTVQTIREYLQRDTPQDNAAALNEFMAWNLTNQNLIEVAKGTRVRSPLAKVVRKALALMKRLLGAIKGDVFNNILFNTKVLLSTPRNIMDSVSANLQLNQFSKAGNDPRIQRMAELFDAKIASHIRAQKNPLKTETTRAIAQASKSTTLFIQNGFSMNMQQKQLFSSIQAALATQMDLDKLSLVRAQKIYKQVIDKLTVESFMENPESTNPNDRHVAQNKFNVLTGAYGNAEDALTRSNLLSSFLALAQVDDGFRAILDEVVLPKTIDVRTTSTNDLLNSLGTSMMNALAITVTREGLNNRNSRQAIDNLTESLGRIEEDSKTFIERSAQGLLDKGDKQGSDLLVKVGNQIGNTADVKAESTTGIRKFLWQSAAVASGAISRERGATLVKVGTEFMNTQNVWTPIREVFEEIVSRTEDNGVVVDMVNKVKYAVSSVRQDFRETLPEIIASRFSRKLSNKEWSNLYRAFGKTDLASLGASYKMDDIVDIISSRKNLTNEIKSLEEELKSLSPKNHAQYMDKSKQLARYMMHGIPGKNLLRNAFAISRLLNEDVRVDTPSQRGIEVIDELTSLYAVEMIDEKTLDSVMELVSQEKDGSEFMTYYLFGLRSEENKKISNDIALLNGYKGYIPSEAQDGVRLIVADNTNHDELIKSGYTRKGAYVGSGVGVEAGKRSYYHSTVSGKNTFSQGAMQTVQVAVNGVDPRSGVSLLGSTAGTITGASIAGINNRIKKSRNLNENEALMPVFGGSGEVVAFERAMDPKELTILNRNEHIGEMLGAWRGRQAEEQIAQGFNEMLVDNIKAVWDRDKTERKDEFVNIADSSIKDPIFKDAWSVIPRDTRDYISSVFGEDTFMVRKDMINNALGYRNASIGDAWTGGTRIDPKIQKALVDSATFIFGKKAFKYLVTGEKGVQTAVSTAKNTIVIRSVFVPVANMLSNQLQLLTRGVAPRDLLKLQRTKLVEIDAHLKNLRRRVEAEAELLTVQDNPIKSRKLETEIKSLNDADKRMSIYPLIQAGEFSTISEGLTDIDVSLSSGKIVDYIEGLVDKLPEGVKTAGKYAIVGRDTALYQGMSRAVQYGDFLGKAVLFEHLMVNEGLNEADALARITNEFVNFNLLPGRTRSYTESMGLTWFWNFKLRTMKVAVDMIQRNPARVLLTGLAAPVAPDLGIGSPITDNFLSVVEDDRLKYSIGPNMLFNAPGLNPWVQLFR